MAIIHKAGHEPAAQDSNVLSPIMRLFRGRSHEEKAELSPRQTKEKVGQIAKNVDALRKAHPDIADRFVREVLQVEALLVSLSVSNTMATLLTDPYPGTDIREDTLSRALGTVLLYKESPGAMRIVARMISINKMKAIESLSDPATVKAVFNKLGAVIKSHGEGNEIDWQAYQAAMDAIHTRLANVMIGELFRERGQ